MERTLPPALSSIFFQKSRGSGTGVRSLPDGVGELNNSGDVYKRQGEHRSGYDRYEKLCEELSKTDGVVADEQAAMDILASVGRRSWNNDDANSCTVHSVVYNLTDRTAFWVPNEHYDDKAAWFTFQLPAES